MEQWQQGRVLWSCDCVDDRGLLHNGERSCRAIVVACTDHVEIESARRFHDLCCVYAYSHGTGSGEACMAMHCVTCAVYY